MNPVALLPTTLGAWASLAAVVAMAVLFFLKKDKLAAMIGLFAGVALGGWVGTGVESLIACGQITLNSFTAKAFGSGATLALFVILGIWFYAKTKGGGNAKGKLQPWLLLVVAIGLGSALGSIPIVATGLSHGISAVNTLTASLR